MKAVPCSTQKYTEGAGNPDSDHELISGRESWRFRKQLLHRAHRAPEGTCRQAVVPARRPSSPQLTILTTSFIQRMHDSGHQIGQHTWSHPDLVGVPIETFNTQMYYAEMAFRNILGLVPTYARPPYFSCDDACYARYGMLGYHAIIADVDTNDWNFTTAETHQAAKDNFVRGMAGRSWTNGLVLAHDVHEQTVRNLTRFMLDTMREQGVGGSITVGECLQDPVENWYRAAGPVIECPPG